MTLDDLKKALENMKEAQKAGSAEISADDIEQFAAFVQRFEDDALTEDDRNRLQLLQTAPGGELSDDALAGVAGGRGWYEGPKSEWTWYEKLLDALANAY